MYVFGRYTFDAVNGYYGEVQPRVVPVSVTAAGKEGANLQRVELHDPGA